jgi:signal transduction histidine kinase
MPELADARADDLVERLAMHRTVGAAPREQLEWLAAHGEVRILEPGVILTPKGVQVEGLFVVLAGHITIHLDRGAGRHKVAEWKAGDVTGLLPYSRLVTPPGDTVAEVPTEILLVPRGELRALILECHELTSIFVHVMLDRARLFTSAALHDEKLVSLGKLAAGLAHELNNPASAVERSARLLNQRLEWLEKAARTLGGARLSDAELAAVDSARDACLATPTGGVRSPIEEARREEEFADWLEDHGSDASLAEPLAEGPLTLDALDGLAATVPAPALDPALRWVAAGCSVRGLAKEIQQASGRISTLVTAVKGFTRMDQVNAAEPVDLAAGLASTVAVLRAKARAKSVTVNVEVPPDLPRVTGNGGELNQVFANLIDNALDAAPASGRVDVTAQRDGKNVLVFVADDGSGIPADIKDRIFEPFFTTKPVGQGTGLGLDIVRRLVLRHDGEIDVTSEPGRTQFRVVLPAAGA